MIPIYYLMAGLSPYIFTNIVEKLDGTKGLSLYSYKAYGIFALFSLIVINI